MNKKFKFLLWIIEFKARKCNADEKIALLANELVKAITSSGRSIECADVRKGFGSLTIYVHNFGTDNADLSIESRGNLEIKTTPTFKKL